MTFVCVIEVLYRFFVLKLLPGASSLAAFSALLAVWLEVFATVTPQLRCQLGAIAALFTTVIVNGFIIGRSLANHKTVPFPRSLFTVMLLAVLVAKARAAIMHRAHSQS